MPEARDDSQLVKVARLYFVDGLSQQDVADTVGVSRSNVSRMLTAARERGIVRIEILDPAGRDADLEQRLATRFGLAEVRVAAFRSGSDPLTEIGGLGAQWVLDNLRDEQTLALSWGVALQHVVHAVTTDRAYPIDVVQLVGGLSAVASAATGQELVRELAARLGATYRYLHAPAILDSSGAIEALRSERSIRAALNTARAANIAIVGVGAIGVGTSAAIVESMNFNRRDRTRFERAEPVGDICARFFDAQGKPVVGPSDDRVLGVTLEELRRIPTVVGVAAGADKAPGLLGALRGRLLDVLVCDANAARAVLATANDPLSSTRPEHPRPTRSTTSRRTS